MNEIKQLLDYVNDGVESELIAHMETHAKAEQTSARVLCIKLLEWLRGRANLGRQYPLRVKRHGWYKALQSAVQGNKQLSSVFECSDKGIDLRSTVDVESLNALVSENYHPILFAD